MKKFQSRIMNKHVSNGGFQNEKKTLYEEVHDTWEVGKLLECITDCDDEIVNRKVMKLDS